MDTDTLAQIEQEISLKEPNMYGVFLHNDDITTMEFVVEILVNIFHKSPIEASALMMDVHNEGYGLAGIYTYDIAITKKYQADQRALEQGFPLKITVSEVSE